MKFKVIFFIVIVSGCITGGAQDPRLPKVVPPSPNAASLQKYGDIPVSLYTGVPNISVPLYEIKSGDISVPISLSYNSSGIKVSEEAGRTGLGWALNAGGVISRNIIQRDDFEDYHGQSGFEIPLGPKFDQGRPFNYQFNCLQSINGYDLPQVLLNMHTSDFQPDQYSYNFNGHSGKFVLRRNKDVVLNKIEKIDLKILDSSASIWEAKTPDGFIYRFEDVESYIDGSQQRKSAWYLSKITSPNGRVVQFVYTTIINDIAPTGSYFESRPIGFVVNPNNEYPSTPSIYSQVVAGKTYHSQYLSEIIFDEGKVQFDYVGGRVDIRNDVQLNSVQIYKKKHGQADELLKSWRFNYSYFESLGGASNPTYPDLHFKRLKLDSLQELAGSDSIPPYIFHYNDGSSFTLPGKLSFSRDHWGYFNGRSNSSLIPTYIGGGGGTVNLGAMGPERNPDTNKVQAFILNEIEYPTGGSTKFEYQTHDFDITKSMVNDHTFLATYIAVVPTIREVNFSNTLAGGTFTATLDLTNLAPANQEVTIGAAWAKTSGGFPPGSVAIMDITCSLKDSSGIEVAGGQIASWLGNTAPPMTGYLGTPQQNVGVNVTFKKTLAPGVYTWTFFVPASYGVQSSNVFVSYTKPESDDPIFVNGQLIHNALFGGGLRIRKITDYTDSGTIAKVRKYNYHYKINDTVYSYGRRMAKPNYSYYDIVNGGGTNRGACLTRESDSHIPLNGSTNGVVVAYDKVEELFGENGENGKTVYEYWNQPDMIWDYHDLFNGMHSIPLKPPYGGIIPDAKNGSLLNQTTYVRSGADFIKNSETINTYQDLTNVLTSVVYGIDKRVVTDQNVPGMECGMLSFFTYPAIATNRPVLTSSVSKIYDVNNTADSIVTTNKYEYNNTTHLQLASRTEYKSSNGDTLITSFKYPADYADEQSDAALLQMKGSSYMHALPIVEQKTIVRGTDKYLKDAKINKYQVLNSKVFPKETALLENPTIININTPPAAYNPASQSYPSGYKARLFFDNYDTSGNLLQVHKSDDHPISYIWDYFSSYPIAELINAEVASCAFTSFESNGKGNWTFSGVPQDDLTAFTGKRVYSLSSGSISATGLSGAKTFLVSYWSKTGSALVNGSTTTAGTSRIGWTFYQHVLPANTTSITISGNVTIDELRLNPKGSLMTTYVYEPLVGITSQTDASHRTTYYEYDPFGRLYIVRDHNRNIIKRSDYKYQDTNNQL